MAAPAKSRAAEERALGAYVKLMRAANSVTSRVKSLAATYDLTLTQFATLEALFHLGPLTLKEVSQKILTSGGNMTMVVDNLERDGMVARRRSDSDRRQIRLELTPKGEEKISAVFPGHATHITELMHALTPEELETLAALCKKLGLAAQS
jgi:MarR family 2-MHQ and catechol resistance regulon transcriptional repressor